MKPSDDQQPSASDCQSALDTIAALLQSKELSVQQGLAELDPKHSQAFVPSIFRFNDIPQCFKDQALEVIEIEE